MAWYFVIFFALDIGVNVICVNIYSRERIKIAKSILVWVVVAFAYIVFHELLYYELTRIAQSVYPIITLALIGLPSIICLHKMRDKLMFAFALILINILFTSFVGLSSMAVGITKEMIFSLPVQIGMNSVLYVIMIGSTVLLKIKYREFMATYENRRQIYWIIFFGMSTLVIAFILVISSLSGLYIGKILALRDYVYGTLITGMVIANVITYIRMLQTEKKRFETLHLEEAYILQAEQLKEYRIIRHGFKNHLAVIDALLNEGDMSTCMSYLEGVKMKGEGAENV